MKKQKRKSVNSLHEQLIYLERDKVIYRNNHFRLFYINIKIKRLNKKIEQEWLKDIGG